jgi:hypothetical protein
VKHPRGMEKMGKRYSRPSVHNVMLLKNMEVISNMKSKKKGKKRRTIYCYKCVFLKTCGRIYLLFIILTMIVINWVSPFLFLGIIDKS